MKKEIHTPGLSIVHCPSFLELYNLNPGANILTKNMATITIIHRFLSIPLSSCETKMSARKSTMVRK